MAWKTLTVEAIENRLTAPEMTALTNEAKKETQEPETILADAIAAVTVEVRGYVAACARNILGPAGSIPDELESAALALLRRHLFTRLPGMRRLFDELRQRETEDALQRLRDTARCDFAIVPPEEAGDQAAGPASEVVSSRTRILTREDTRGL